MKYYCKNTSYFLLQKHAQAARNGERSEVRSTERDSVSRVADAVAAKRHAPKFFSWFACYCILYLQKKPVEIRLAFFVSEKTSIRDW